MFGQNIDGALGMVLLVNLKKQSDLSIICNATNFWLPYYWTGEGEGKQIAPSSNVTDPTVSLSFNSFCWIDDFQFLLWLWLLPDFFTWFWIIDFSCFCHSFTERENSLRSLLCHFRSSLSSSFFFQLLKIFVLLYCLAN